MNKTKVLIIGGGVALAAGAIWYIKRSERQAETPVAEPSKVPVTYFSSQEAAGNMGNFGGGGAPAESRPGVTTTPELAHNNICGPDQQGVGISAIAGQKGGIKCIPRNQVTPALNPPDPVKPKNYIQIPTPKPQQ